MVTSSDQIAAAVRRLRTVLSDPDDAAVLSNSALTAARILEQGSSRVDVFHLLGVFYWKRFLLRGPAGQSDLQSSIDAFTAVFIAVEAPIPAALLPYVADAAVPVATSLFDERSESSGISAASRLVELWRRIAGATPQGHHDRQMRLAYLSALLSERYQRVGDSADLDEAIIISRDLLSISPSSATYLFNLGLDLETRANATGSKVDRDEAIESFRKAIAAVPPDDPRAISSKLRLFYALYERFEKEESLSDVDEVIELGKIIVANTSSRDPQRIVITSDLSVALSGRFRLTKVRGDVDEAIDLDREVLRFEAPDSPEWLRHMDYLGVDLLARHKIADTGSDAREAIEVFRTAIDCASTDHPQYMFLCSDLIAALLAAGGSECLDEAIEIGERLLEPARELPAYSALVVNLSQALNSRANHSSAMTDLNRAIQLGRHAAHVAPEKSGGRAELFCSLCANLFQRYEQTAGTLSDLNEAVAAGREAVNAVPAHSSRVHLYLINLASALHLRYLRAKQADDLAEAIVTARAAVPSAAQDQVDRGLCLALLAHFLRSRYLQTQDISVLNEAIQAARGAVDAVPRSNSNRFICLEHLAICLTARCRATLSSIEREFDPEADLAEAIRLEREASSLIPDENPRALRLKMNLATAMMDRYQFFTSDPVDIVSAMQIYQEVGDLHQIAPFDRVHAKLSASRLASPPVAARLLAEAVRLLPATAPRGQERRDQQHSLGEFEGITGAATALQLSIAGEDNEQTASAALELLEAGRAVLMSQALETRTDLTDLMAHQPELAKRFVELRERLNRPAGDDGNLLVAEPQVDRTMAVSSLAELGGRDRQALAEAFRELVATIKEEPGFESFMDPPTAHDLMHQAAEGPIIVLNIDQRRCDALVVRESHVADVHLGELSLSAVRERVVAFHEAIARAGRSTRQDERLAEEQVIFGTLEWLWDTVVGPIFGELGWLEGERDGELPRLWWAPGGILGLLPLHAAGYHRESGIHPRRTAMDLAVSSYIPTIRALRYARERASEPVANEGTNLVVVMSSTPGMAPLDYANEEAAAVGSRLSSSETVRNSDATRERILRALDSASAAHFACHGRNDPLDPSQSCLILVDHEQSPLTISVLTTRQLDHAQLAYLSACQTAIPAAPQLADEFIHMTSAFQLVGFPHVVGTLWEINDFIAVEVADSFYANLSPAEGVVNADRPARALRAAVRTMRENFPGLPSLWAAYLHVGA